MGQSLGRAPARAAIVSADINDGVILTAKLADSAVTAAKIAIDTIEAGDVAANAITASELADNAVDTAAIAADAVDGTKIADNAVDSEHIAADSIDAEHYAAGSVDATAIGNDVVDSQHYAAGSIDAAHIADDQITLAKMAGGTDGQIITYDASGNPVAVGPGTDGQVLTSTGVGSPPAFEAAAETSSGPKAHIIPGVLYPAVAGKLLDGSTSHSGAYGTAQADTFKYYYTDIKGSKPIKDPRIGAHFGSQRHKFKSLQLLEQETATSGLKVWSIDGRENMRVVGTASGNASASNDSAGTYFYFNSTAVYIEITGYFNNINLGEQTETGRGWRYSLDGASEVGTSYGTASSNSPLGGRYVDGGSFFNIPITPSLGIHTIKLRTINSNNVVFGVELIAQDTTSTATKSKIQIPSQNVVSYGKKFTVAGTPHYNPFAFAGDGTTAVAIADTTSHGKVATGWAGSTSAYFDSTLDTATSLGLSAWEKGGNYWRPVNGGRIIKWVDSSGNIKTSVNMMPPAGRHWTGGGNSGDPDGTSWLTSYAPSFMAGAIDHSQAEVAKTFYWREYGNGAANGGSGAAYADGSMLSDSPGSDNIAYCMDDGLTTLSALEVFINGTERMYTKNPGTSKYWFTFIGTGLTIDGNYHVAQNLPYGTHIMFFFRNSSSSDLYIDGVQISGSRTEVSSVLETTFHQPKMPPIPEDAVVIADYMLTADFVPVSGSGLNLSSSLSKGTRMVDSSRDYFYESGSSWSNLYTYSGWFVGGSRAETTSSSAVARLPFFGTNSVECGYPGRVGSYLNGSATSNQTTVTSTDTWTTSITHDGVTLGSNQLMVQDVSTNLNMNMCYIVSPTHTSSHYQTFETPYLHELVGGDRNMEQTNLVVTADGKTWDQVTRNTSYIGNAKLKTAHDNIYGNVVNIFDEWRGGTKSVYEGEHFNKDFAIAHDRMICLKSGNYLITHMNWHTANDDSAAIKVNGTYMTMGKTTDSGIHTDTATVTVNLGRGDYVQGVGTSGDGSNQWKIHINFQIIEI